MRYLAFYTTLEIAIEHGFDRDEINSTMADFDKTTATSDEGYIAIIDRESGETVDYAHPILVQGDDGLFYGNVLFSEMEIPITIGNDVRAEPDQLRVINFMPIPESSDPFIFRLKKSGDFYEVKSRENGIVTLSWLHGNYSRKVTLDGLKRLYTPAWSRI